MRGSRFNCVCHIVASAPRVCINFFKHDSVKKVSFSIDLVRACVQSCACTRDNTLATYNARALSLRTHVRAMLPLLYGTYYLWNIEFGETLYETYYLWNIKLEET